MTAFPAFANGHSHAFHRALRGRRPRGTDFWGWREGMYALAQVLDPQRYHRLARATFAEMRLAGFEAVGEFHYLHHAPGGVAYADPSAMAEAVIEAARDVGLHLTLLHTRYARSGFAGAAPDPAQQRFIDPDLEAWQARTAELAVRYADDPLVVIGTAIHSVRAVPASEFATIADTLPDAPLHVHLSEQPAENADCLAATGRTPTQLLAEAGVWSPRATAVHATHLTSGDIAILGESGSHVCFCPSTEAELADGIGPSVALREAGARITLGSDSNTVIDGFAEARGLAMHERLASGRRDSWAAEQLWTAASADGFASLGFAQLSELRRELRPSVQTAGVSESIWAGSAGQVVPPPELDAEAVAAELSAAIEELWELV